MNGFYDTLFGPLPRSYCVYFSILSIFGFIMLLITLFAIGKLLMDKSRDSKALMASFVLLVSYFVIYFQNRILQGMCSHSLA